MDLVYGEKELNYLKKKDKKLGVVIDKIGFISRAADADLFLSLVHAIVAQQIAAKAAESVWKRMQALLGEITPQTVSACSPQALQKCGMSFRKVNYIQSLAQKVQNRSFDLKAVEGMSDTDAITALSSLDGIGVWTAEMILLFCLQRPNIFSYGDLGIKRGLCLIYHHKKITKQLFEKYRRRYSPYGSVASLYLWAVAGGALPEIK